MNGSAVTPVVAGVSGSAAGSRAVEMAAREAAVRGLPLRLVHALQYRHGVIDQARQAGDLLRQARETALATAPGLWTTVELVEGDPVTGLLRLSRQAALTVLGDGSLGEQVCLPREATTVQVAARAFSTVLVVRAPAAPQGPVLVGVSGSTMSGAVLARACEAAAGRAVGLDVVHVGEVSQRVRVLEDVITSRALAYGVGVRFDVVAGDPAAVLRQRSREASLVVVGARGELPYHGLLGSVSQALLHHARGPVLVVRASRSAPIRRAAALVGLF
ncbi:universal stress protein [Actinoplanes philippinensis]|uniref:Universal stress protein family protein n=1 Tax=Actinoplanes philippinensis TaxID=35752 RepID=A0A1I2HY77_9ACTN|nr:universal stress protein [Actinoplanes philippinensis]GIE78910.1 universal stress protein [Actinoplanes philippinensis]SFF34290.1 Universal stress protein family protein [Actinoplanes philippinensis]